MVAIDDDLIVYNNSLVQSVHLEGLAKRSCISPCKMRTPFVEQQSKYYSCSKKNLLAVFALAVMP